jgi:MFS family permease
MSRPVSFRQFSFARLPVVTAIRRVFQPPQPVPDAYRRNFALLYADIAWYGLLNGSTLSFLTIYATRIGASADQLGLINAAPAVISLLLALPGGMLLERRAVGKAVFWSAVLHRVFYLLYALLPLVAANAAQVWILIFLIFLMNIPGSILGLGFNALFAAAVPPEWRGHVVGTRNAIFSVTTVITTLISGVLLKALVFPLGYQIVFGIGFAGAVMSTLMLYWLKPAVDRESEAVAQTVDEGETRPRPALLETIRAQLHLEILRSPFAKVLLLLAAFHLTQYLPIPIFPIYQVNTLGLSDQTLSFGSALFSATVMIGSTQLARVSSRIGQGRTTGLGMVLLSIYPTLLSMATGAGLYLVANFIGGFAWALAGGAIYNYLLERVPAETRAAHLAWFTVAANAAILIGSLSGPVIAGFMTLNLALLIFALARLAAGIAIMRWG